MGERGGRRTKKRTRRREGGAEFRFANDNVFDFLGGRGDESTAVVHSSTGCVYPPTAASTDVIVSVGTEVIVPVLT
eukprot:753267-Rhodomonas_salina.1